MRTRVSGRTDTFSTNFFSVVHVHKPKVEFFDVPGRTNTDPKGFVRHVDAYRVEPWGLYMARPSDHARFHYLESWLLPSVGLRTSIFHMREDMTAGRIYIDIGEFTSGPDVWTSVDHYLDLVVLTGERTELLDVDELIAASATGLVTASTAEDAVEKAVAAVDGIAAHGYSCEAWLESLDMPITWR
jgi:uncharacterized protein